MTLLTCTPYGINSHRLLVRGHRVPYEPELLLDEKIPLSNMSLHTNYLLWVVAGLFVTAVFCLFLYRKERRLAVASAGGGGQEAVLDGRLCDGAFDAPKMDGQILEARELDLWLKESRGSKVMEPEEWRKEGQEPEQQELDDWLRDSQTLIEEELDDWLKESQALGEQELNDWLRKDRTEETSERSKQEEIEPEEGQPC